MNKIIIYLLTLNIFSLSATYKIKNVILYHYPFENILLKIESVSPDGNYAIVNICDFSDSLSKVRKDYLTLPVQIQLVLDIKSYDYWPLLDTITFVRACNFNWSEASKEVLFSVSHRHPKDTFELFPIYLYQLKSRKLSNLMRPWLSTTYYNIPLFSHRESEIIFWTPRVVVDTSQDSYTNIGIVFRFNTLKKLLIKIKKSADIAFVDWMNLYDTTSFYINADGTLGVLSLSTGKMEPFLADIQIVSKITTFQNKIVFCGRTEKGDKIYVYDLKKNSFETILHHNRGLVLSAVVNEKNKLAIETVKSGRHWIFIVSKEGVVLDSLKANSPFWLAGTDSLIYSDGKKIGLAYWRNKQLEKEIILEVTK